MIWCNDPHSSYAMLQRAAGRHGDRPAVSFFLEAAHHEKTESLTYRALLDGVTRLANLLHDVGVGPDDVVAVMLPNLPETHLAMWGGQAASIVMPVNPLLEPATFAALLTAADARVLVTLGAFPGSDIHDKAVEVVEATPSLKHVVLVDMAVHVPGTGHIVRRVDRRWSHRGARRRPRPTHHVCGPAIFQTRAPAIQDTSIHRRTP